MPTRSPAGIRSNRRAPTFLACIGGHGNAHGIKGTSKEGRKLVGGAATGATEESPIQIDGTLQDPPYGGDRSTAVMGIPMPHSSAI